MAEVAEELETSPLEMSDDELLNMAPPEDVPAPEGVDDVSVEEPAADPGNYDPEDEPDGLQEEVQTPTEEEVGADPATPPPENAGDGSEEQSGVQASEDAGETGDQSPSGKETPTIDYKTEYERLLAPFKANGRQMQVTDVNDAIHLMQMGANYNKKMAGLKPNLKLMKMLERNELLDEEKLSFLIDLQKKDPAAIAQFIKDSGVDPLDIDVDKDAEKYKPKTYTVGDTEIDLDEVLDSIQDTPSFKQTIDIISTKWDAASKQVALDNPPLIKIINEQVESGIYDQITDIVENERALGRLPNMTDLEAYKHVGDVIQANGGFNPKPPPANEAPATVETPAATPPAAAGAAPTNADLTLNDRRRAAGSTRNAPVTSSTPDYNPLSLSDEEFEKISGGQYN